MKFFEIKSDLDVGPIPMGLNIDRYQAHLLGWHFATFYRHDIVLQKTGDHTTHWWLYVSPLDHLGFGIGLPPWLSRFLGLSRDYSRDVLMDNVTIEEVFAAVQNGELTQSEAVDLLIQIRLFGSQEDKKEVQNV